MNHEIAVAAYWEAFYQLFHQEYVAVGTSIERNTTWWFNNNERLITQFKREYNL